MIYQWKKIVRESAPILMACAFIAVLSGQLLNANQDKLIAVPVLLTFIPVINGIGGNLGCVLGARISSSLHLGSIASMKDKKLYENVFISFLLGIITYSFLSIFIYLIIPLIDIEIDIEPMKFVSIFMIAGIMLTALVTIIAVATAFLSFMKGIDPDNTVTPLVTTLGDALGIGCLTMTIWMVGI